MQLFCNRIQGMPCLRRRIFSFERSGKPPACDLSSRLHSTPLRFRGDIRAPNNSRWQINPKDGGGLMTPREEILDLLGNDSAPGHWQCFLLTHGQRAAFIHVINGGSLDVSLGTSDGCVAADSNGGGESVVLLPGDDTERAAQ